MIVWLLFDPGWVSWAGDFQRGQLLNKRRRATVLYGEPSGNDEYDHDDVGKDHVVLINTYDNIAHGHDDVGHDHVDNDNDDDDFIQPGRNYSIGVRAVSNNIESVSNTAFQATRNYHHHHYICHNHHHNHHNHHHHIQSFNRWTTFPLVTTIKLLSLLVFRANLVLLLYQKSISNNRKNSHDSHNDHPRAVFSVYRGGQTNPRGT